MGLQTLDSSIDVLIVIRLWSRRINDFIRQYQLKQTQRAYQSFTSLLLSYLTFPVDILIQCCGDVETNPGPLDTELGKTPLLYEMAIFHRYIMFMIN